jgi:uncharacterized membrane protein YraQ (UPF0718 family)
MTILLILTGIILLISLLKDIKKTIEGIKKGFTMFFKVLPAILNMLIFVSVFLYIISNEVIIKLLGKNSGITGISIAAVLGSVSLIPAFIAYPLSAVLLRNGVSYQITAIFITTLMMVGIITLPLESKYFGWRVSILRNSLSFVGAIIIGLLIGLFI